MELCIAEMEDHLNEAMPEELEDELSDEEITFETRIIETPEKVENLIFI